MIRGLYTAAAGMVVGLMRQETVTHNLANVQTTGYKADRAAVKNFPEMLLSQMRKDQSGPEVGTGGTGVSLAAIVTDFTTGPLNLTDHPLDFAIAGDGFFQVQTEDGVRLTRDGRFHRDSDGQLITANGHRVLGSNGAITLPEGPVTVTLQGNLFVYDQFIDQISLARVDDPQTLVKDGQTTFDSAGAQPIVLEPNEIQIYQGYLEDSNVDTAQAVTEMTSVLRAYQASQRLVQFQDQINGRAVTELGRL